VSGRARLFRPEHQIKGQVFLKSRRGEGVIIPPIACIVPAGMDCSNECGKR